jgi:DNA-cytosine methyltransferase
MVAGRKPHSPTVVSLFAGGGGSSMGYRAAGYDVRLAVEWAKYPAAAYRLNFPNTLVYEGDVSKLTVDNALSMARLGPSELDVLDGSPPCQGFSTAGKRDLTDPRNSLFKEYARLLAGLRPRAFVMENVSGMVKGKMRWVFREALRELKACGYRVSCRLLDAKWFGVPQSRKRVIFIGLREDLCIDPSHPIAEREPISVGYACPWLGGFAHVAGERAPGSHWKPHNKAFDVQRDAAGVLSKSSGSYVARDACMQAPDLHATVAKLAERMRPGENGSQHRRDGSWRDRQIVDPSRPSPSITKTAEFNGLMWLMVRPRSNYLQSPALSKRFQELASKLMPGKSAKTVDPSTSSPTVRSYGSFGHDLVFLSTHDKPRGLSVGEVMRLCSFPDEYRFPESGAARKDWADAWAVCGNSVPPMFMRAIAAHVRAVLENASDQ